MDDPAAARARARSLRSESENATSQAASLRSQAASIHSQASGITDAIERGRVDNRGRDLDEQAAQQVRLATDLSRQADDLDMHATRRGMELQGEADDKAREADRLRQDGDSLGAARATHEADELRQRAAGA